VSSFEAEVLARQLAQLGRDLDAEVIILGDMEHAAVSAEWKYRTLLDAHKDDLAREFLHAEGSVDKRSNIARLECIASREIAEEAWRQWQDGRADVWTQKENLSALHERISIGRSLLSREKALLSLAGVNET
jgi:hypothetical protein